MRLFAITLLLSTFTTSIAQSPWVAEKGKGFVQLGYTTIGPYNDLYLSNGNAYTLSRELTDQTIQAYGEYGIGSATSIIASLPFKLLKTGDALLPNPTFPSSPPNAGGTFSTPGNIQVAVRHNFVNKGIVFTGQLLTELPTAGYDDPTGLRGGLDALSILPSVSIGSSSNNFYEYLSTGVAIRTNNYSSEWRLNMELGYKILNRIYLIAVVDRVQNWGNGSAIEPANQLQTGLYLNNQSFVALGIKTIVGFTDNLGVSGAFYGAGSGNFVAKSPSLNFGLYYKW